MARQQERARRTRAAIIRSAAVEFGKSGYAAASLNRILEGSRATKGAMYFHFDSKEDLARAVLDTALDRYRFSADRWLARTDLGPLDVMHGMLDEIALRLEHDIIVQAEFRLIIEPDFYREVPNGGGRIIARATRALAVRAIEQGQLRADADPDRFARTLAAAGGGGDRGGAAAGRRAPPPPRPPPRGGAGRPALLHRPVRQRGRPAGPLPGSARGGDRVDVHPGMGGTIPPRRLARGRPPGRARFSALTSRFGKPRNLVISYASSQRTAVVKPVRRNPGRAPFV